jgi:hypothetical protein
LIDCPSSLSLLISSEVSQIHFVSAAGLLVVLVVVVEMVVVEQGEEVVGVVGWA